jgi:hypothetical protein
VALQWLTNKEKKLLRVPQTLLTAKLHEEDYPGIFKSISGLVFLGTPHRGSNSQSKASLIASIATAVGFGKKSQILNVVDKDSESLSDLVHDFTRAVITRNIDIFCFFEQHASDISKVLKPRGADWISYKVNIGMPFSRIKTCLRISQEMMVDEHSATLDGFAKLGLACDHFQMSHYVSAADSNYCYIRAEIKRIVDAAPDRLSKKILGT